MISITLANLTHAGDRLAVAGLLSEYAATLGDAIEAPLDVVLDGLHECGHCLNWVAWDGREPVGLAVCFQVFSTFAGRRVINIHDLAVRASHRGKGIGTKLLHAIAAEGQARGCSKVTLEVRDDNPEAERLYRRFGFSDPDGRPTRFLSFALESAR